MKGKKMTTVEWSVNGQRLSIIFLKWPEMAKKWSIAEKTMSVFKNFVFCLQKSQLMSLKSSPSKN